MNAEIDITSMIILLPRISNLLRASGKTEIIISAFSPEIPIPGATFFLLHGVDSMKLRAFSDFNGDSPIDSLFHFCGI
jgi:hypothetical protein